MTTIEPIKRVKIYQEIARRLEAQIFDGRLKPGDALPSERELMDRYGVGRPAVREALLSLEKSGFIAITNGERARVIQPTAAILVGGLGSAARYLLHQPQGVRELQEVRAFFEIGLARHAAEHATPEDLARLEAALATNAAMLDDLVAFGRSDVEFHFVLAQIARNSIILAFHAALAEWLTEQRSTTLLGEATAKAALKAHRAIFRAVKARNPDAAERAMRRHLDEVQAMYWKAKEAGR